ncbi:MAG TPA: metallophosphoesterase family protein [Ktedonobacteraceae bacterium]|nr:metallophosphoesterase family protein [Ktedonobacteraceae bacterium]
MKIAAIYDIHGNLPALEAVLKEIEQVHPDCILVGGDIVSGPMPEETLERLLAIGDKVHFIRGNADREVVAAFDGIPLDPGLPEEVRELTIWAAKQLDTRHRDFLAQLPEQAILHVDSLGDVLFCHASPRNDTEIFTVATPEARLRTILAGVKQNVVVCGHTHMQYIRRIGNIDVVNAGSVGMPYGEPGAYWLLLGPAIVPQRTLYDLNQAGEHIRASDYPQAQDFADNNVLNPPPAAEVIEVFERMAETKN